MASKMYYCRQTTEKCKSIKYPSTAHPYKKGKSGCVYTSGCGVASSLMVLRNLTDKKFDTAQWTAKLLDIGAREAEGTNINIVAKYLEKNYGITYKSTKSTAELVTHLKKGGKAIINVSGGGKKLFSDSGHYVFCGGIDQAGNLIILDPYWYENKFISTANRKNYTKVKNEREVYVQPAALKSDISIIWLFNAKGKNIKYSVNDVNYHAIKPPVVNCGTYTLTNARGIYKNYGADSGRKKIKDLTPNAIANATSKSKNADALLKAGTKITIYDTKLLSSGNLWARIPSGYLCIWEHKDNKKFIK